MAAPVNNSPMPVSIMRPQHFALYLLLLSPFMAVAYFQMNEAEQFIPLRTQVPEVFEYNKLGIAQLRAGDLQQARIWLHEALRLAEHSPREADLIGPWRDTAEVEYTNGNFAESLEALNYAIQIADKSPDVPASVKKNLQDRRSMVQRKLQTESKSQPSR